jgi:hypothetical protein
MISAQTHGVCREENRFTPRIKCGAGFFPDHALIKNPGRRRGRESRFAKSAMTNRHRALACCLGMIFSENRFTLFRIMPPSSCCYQK